MKTEETKEGNNDNICFQLRQSRPWLTLDPSITDTNSNVKSMEYLQFSTVRYTIFLVLNVPCLFLLYPFYKSFLFARLLTFRSSNLSSATHILVKTKDSSWEISKLNREIILDPEPIQFLWWEFRNLRYYINLNTEVVHEVSFNKNLSFRALGNYFEGEYAMTEEKYVKYRKIYGENKYYVSYIFAWKMMQKELLNPFTIYEILSAVFWIYQEYTVYAVVIIVLSLTSIASIFYDVVKEIRALRGSNQAIPSVLVKFTRPDTYVLIDNKSIVPGMRCKITAPQKVGFDCILMSGKCYTNQLAITGAETSKLITSLPFGEEPEATYNILQHNEHTIYAGSQIEDMGGEDCEVLVISTGFSTQSGKLISNMLYPGSDKYVKYKDALWFALGLGIICLFCYFVCLPTFVHEGNSAGVFIENLLDLITTAVPPIVPAAMSIGTSMALKRLRESSIYCVSPSKIPIAGKATLLCIDIKGTIIEETQSFVAYQLTDSSTFSKYSTNLQKIPKYFSSPSKNKNKSLLARALAACHMLTLRNNAVMGNKEEEELLTSTKAALYAAGENLVEAKLPGSEVSVEQVRRREWRGVVSVVVKCGGEYWVYARTKEVGSVCEEMPADWKEVKERYEKNCCLVYGMCAKRIEVEEVQKSWDELCTGMNLLAFIILKIVIKENALLAIQELQKANIPCIMLTSENLHVASVVAKAVGIIRPHEPIFFNDFTANSTSPLSLQWLRLDPPEINSGLNNSEHHKGILDEAAFYSNSNPQLITNKRLLPDSSNAAVICHNGALQQIAGSLKERAWDTLRQVRVFADLNEEGVVTQLVNGLSKSGESVMMVGAVGSEYEALSKSDVGVLVSSSEQVCVFSALTCSKYGIMSIPTIISEGRASIVTSYECFKWMALCSIIQLTGTVILYYYSLYMTDEQYLYVDLFLVIPLAYTMGWSRAKKKLNKEQPSSSLLSLNVLLSVIGQMAIQAIAQVRLLVSEDRHVRVARGRRPIVSLRQVLQRRYEVC